MDLNEWARQIHDNAIKHGWWSEPRNILEVFALIHAELSEALEAAREGQKPVWYDCRLPNPGGPAMGECSNCAENVKQCEFRKPDGIAVELIDAAIRTLDYIGYAGIAIDGDFESLIEYADRAVAVYDPNRDTGAVIGLLHYMLSVCWSSVNTEKFADNVRTFLATVFHTVKQLGSDPEFLMREKHEFNITRPYRHGKLF